MGTPLYLVFLVTFNSYLTSAYQGSGYSPLEDDEDMFARNRYANKDNSWCSPIKVKNGHATCSSPYGSYYKTIRGTRCNIHCQKGFELHGASQVICQSDKRWSDKYACKQKRCPTLSMPLHGGFKCIDGAYFNSRCEYYCSPGYQLKGERIVTCMDNKAWSGKPASCIVRRCGKLNAPENGYIKCSGDGDNYGATCEYFCVGGYELQGSSARVCQFNLAWSGAEPTCSFMNINVGVRNAAVFLDQFYEKRRLLILSTPTAADLYYRLQLGMLQQAQCGLDLRHVTVIELFGIYPTYIGRIGRRLLPPALGLQLRLLLQIPQNKFQMVVMDKHGMDKERYAFPVNNVDLFTLIDAFPLRKDEMKFQAEAGHTCN
ncbi:sushi repeat-containing protein SRPX isoform X5 [Ascaphus truei]|uniref:sushi repeat-containing protein SRPX isoform X5 n=1 Tax=Ascaphus truei TaxID=8439 RepID=UPI003F592051